MKANNELYGNSPGIIAGRDSHQRGPPRGFGDSGRRAIYIQGFGEKVHLFSGILGESITFWEQGAEEKTF